MDTPDKKALAILARHNRLKSEQSNFRTLWQDAADYIMPRKGNIETRNTPGQEQTRQLYDTTAEEAALVFAAGLLSNLTPAGELWARFTAKEDAPQEEKDWLDECTQRAIRIVHSSNFYLGWHEDCLDAGIFGSSLLFVEESAKGVINVVNVPVGTFTWCENANGMVDTIHREFHYTASQAVERWGYEKLPEIIQKAADDEMGKDKRFTFVHAVYPRAKGEWREGLVDGKLRRFASCYVCVECSAIVEEGGYYENPYAAGRLLRSNNECYGRGPGIQVLPEIKLLNRMEQDLLLGLEKLVNPPWLMPEESAYRPDNRPNGVTYYDASNPNGKPEQMQLNNRIDMGEQKTEQKRGRIRSAFHVDMFQMLSNVDQMKREKTAFEVSQLIQEKLVLFSPIFARVVHEKLNPFMERLFGVCMRAGVFPPPPESVIQRGVLDYEVEYVSKIALAIRAAVNNSLAVMMQLVTEMAQFDPSVVHVIKWREAARDVMSNQGFPAKWRRSDDEVDAIMQGIQQSQMQAMLPDAADKLAGAAQKLGPKGQAAAAAMMGA